MRQRVGEIFQTAFIVRDLDAAMAEFARSFGIRGYFLMNHVPIINPDYRGQPVAPDFSVAICYSGTMQFELMQQHCNTPSVYKERMDRFGEGYHHMAKHVADFDAAQADYLAQGYSLAYTAETVGLGRLAYFERPDTSGTFVELLEPTPAFLAVSSALESAYDAWDGSGGLVIPFPQIG